MTQIIIFRTHFLVMQVSDRLMTPGNPSHPQYDANKAVFGSFGMVAYAGLASLVTANGLQVSTDDWLADVLRRCRSVTPQSAARDLCTAMNELVETDSLLGGPNREAHEIVVTGWNQSSDKSECLAVSNLPGTSTGPVNRSFEIYPSTDTSEGKYVLHALPRIPDHEMERLADSINRIPLDRRAASQWADAIVEFIRVHPDPDRRGTVGSNLTVLCFPKPRSGEPVASWRESEPQVTGAPTFCYQGASVNGVSQFSPQIVTADGTRVRRFDRGPGTDFCIELRLPDPPA